MTRGLGLPGVGRPQGGLALIAVLLVLALLLTVVGEFTVAMRFEGATTLNFQAVVSATYLAEAAYHRAVAEILPEAVAQHFDESGLLVFRRAQLDSAEAPERRNIPLGPGRISYRITDEESRLSLNRTRPELLHRLLIELDVERETRDVIVDSVLDWRDANEEHRLNGAESDYYLALPAPYRSKNADFDSLDELLQVRGVTREIFYGRPEGRSPGKCAGLADCLTVATTGALNVNTASDTALRTLGFAQAEVDFLKAGRPYRDISSVPTQLRRGNMRTRSETFRIEASGEIPGLSRRTVTAVVQRRLGRDRTARVILLSWQWNADEAAQ